jgi:hypothetical protein
MFYVLQDLLEGQGVNRERDRNILTFWKALSICVKGNISYVLV